MSGIELGKFLRKHAQGARGKLKKSFKEHFPYYLLGAIILITALVYAVSSIFHKVAETPIIQKNTTVETVKYKPIIPKEKLKFDVKATYLGTGHIKFNIHSSRPNESLNFYVYSEGLQYGMKGKLGGSEGEVDYDRIYSNVIDYSDRNCPLTNDICPTQDGIDSISFDASGNLSKDILLYSRVINKYKFSDMDRLRASANLTDNNKAQNLSSKYIAEKEGKVYLSFTMPLYTYSGDKYVGGPLEPSEVPDNCKSIKIGREDFLYCRIAVPFNVDQHTKDEIQQIETNQKKIDASTPTNAFLCAKAYMQGLIKYSDAIPDPDSVDFPGADYTSYVKSPGVFVVRSYFKAENYFGATVKHYYSCEVKYPPTDGCATDILDISDSINCTDG